MPRIRSSYLQTYGMTESFSQSVTFNILDFPDKTSSVGRPLPGVEIEIRQADLAGVVKFG